MADDLTTFSGIEAVLAATALYDVDGSVADARRRVGALRRKLDFAQSSSEEGRSLNFNIEAIERQLQQALAFVRANTTPSEADRLRNPDVVHADFSTFGQYGGLQT